jgi:hypothetical protein
VDGQQPIVGHQALSPYFRARPHARWQVTVNAVIRVDKVTATQ